MRRFTLGDLVRICDLAARGYSAIGIGRDLGRTPEAIRMKCMALGIRLRRLHRANKARVVLADDVLALLHAAAEIRGVTRQKLASLILSAVAYGDLIDAVIDDEVPAPRRMHLNSRTMIGAGHGCDRRASGDDDRTLPPSSLPRRAGFITARGVAG